MRIIPAIDILNGQCVRLTEGKYEDVNVYGEKPFVIAQQIENYGAKYLHVVDLDGAKSSGVVNFDSVRRICDETSLTIDFGGGIKSDSDITRILECGVQQVTVGSLAVKDPNKVKEWLEKFGPDKIILGADCREEKIAISGWLEKTDLHIEEFIENFLPYGLKYLISTDISKDGRLGGAANELYKKLVSNYPELNVIASGGVRNLDDLKELSALGCEGAIVGKALYEGTMSWNQLSEVC